MNKIEEKPSAQTPRQVYLDHAATTPVRREVLEEMIPFFTQTFGNPSSQHPEGWAAKDALNEARKRVAESLSVLPEEIIFTSGGTEANNLAIQGAARATTMKSNPQVLLAATEHLSVLRCIEPLQACGVEVITIPVDHQGIINHKAFEQLISERTVLISVSLGNNELGTIQPMQNVVKLARHVGALIHTDAIQAIGKIPVNIHDLGVDLLTISGHKLNAPKGTGVLYRRRGTPCAPLQYGGEQEQGFRAGTENVPGIMALTKALELALSEQPDTRAHLTSLRDYFEQQLQQQVPGVTIHASKTERLPHISNISFPDIPGRTLVRELATRGISISTGSACSSGSSHGSHVLQAIQCPPQEAWNTVRFSIGRDTDLDNLNYTIDILRQLERT